jgi:Holliday junction DNA helicase RuvA
MIARLRGTLIEKHPHQAVVEAAGVGYDVSISVATFTALPGPGAEVQLRIHTAVREDAIQLFGFATADEKALFERLITVSGIGPRLAITVLSGLRTPDLIRVIRAGEVASLVRVPGIGKKTAERIVLELRDKMDAFGAAPPAKDAPGPAALSALETDVVSALVNLGSQRGAAESAVRSALADGLPAEFEPLFRRSLELLR